MICRFRPANERERRENVAAKQAEGLTLDVLDSHTVQVVGPGSKETLSFTFDHVFNESAPQRQVYEVTARDTVADMLDGYNGTIFAYGQTGAGKTYTMTSNLVGSAETRGIIPRACSQLFSHIEQDTSGTEYTIKCSFLEIYKEALHDLLDPKSATKLKIRETPSRGVWVEGLTEAFVGSENDIFSLLQLGEQSRSVAATNMNAVSSRSHTLFVITLVQKLKDGSTRSSRLNLADLAGSEKVGKTGATGETLEEAKKINQSLSALGNCIVALTKAPEKRKHVPYRDSKLTFILRESLGGNSKTTLLIACSPHLYNLEETISTLRFGQRAKSIRNQVKINAHRSVAELELIVQKLQSEVSRLRAYSKTLEQELVTKCPNETIDFQALQEKAWLTLKPSENGEPSRPVPSSSSRASPTLVHPNHHLSVPGSSNSGAIPNTTRSHRAMSGSGETPSSGIQRPRSATDSEPPSSSSSPSPLSASLSFLPTIDGASDGTRSPPSEDSDFWAPMSLVEAQLAYDRMKEEYEFKLQDALDELAQARDENGIEEHKAKLTQEFEMYKANHDAKMADVQTHLQELVTKITAATEQAESLAEQLSIVTEERDALLETTRRFSVESSAMKQELEISEKELKRQSEEIIGRLESEKARVDALLEEQIQATNQQANSLEEATTLISKLTADLTEARESKNEMRTQLQTLRLEIESAKAATHQKELQLVESASLASKLEIRLQEYIGRAEEQGKATGEGLRMLGDINKSLTEKNQALFEEKNSLMSRQSELQLKLDIAQTEVSSLKSSRASDQSRISSLESECSSVKADLDHLKASTMKAAQTLELQVKDLERSVVEEKRSTLQAELQIERSRVEIEVARSETLRVKADLEKELATMTVKMRDDKRSFDASLSDATTHLAAVSEERSSLSHQLSGLNTAMERMKAEMKMSDETSTKRIQSLEEDLTDARVALRRAKEEVEELKEEKVQLQAAAAEAVGAASHASFTASAAPQTPAKSFIGRDPTANSNMMLRGLDSHFGSKASSAVNSRISMPVSHSLGGTSGAAGLLSSRTASTPTPAARPAKVASSILNTPSIRNDQAHELSGWFQVCTCLGKATSSSGWKRLWVVARDRKITCYENQEQRHIVEALQLRGCQLLQLPNTAPSLVDQPTEHCFVLISNADETDDSQDEYAFAAQSSDLVNAFVQHLIGVDCEMLAFATLRLETASPQVIVSAPAPSSSSASSSASSQKSAFMKLGQGASSSSTPSSNSSSGSTPARSFLSGIFG